MTGQRNVGRLLLRDLVHGLWVAFYIVWFPAAVIGGFTGRSPLWVSILLLVLGPVHLVWLADVYRRNETPVTSRLLATMQNEMPADDFQYVLYLRSFLVDRDLSGQDPVGGVNALTTLAGYFGVRHSNLDKPWENRITDLLGELGPVVAVGRPEEALPPLGAQRVYLDLPPGLDWKDKVSAAIAKARLVVIVAAADEGPGAAEGTRWEFSEAVRLSLPPERVILLAAGGRDAYERFRARLAGQVLPDWPEARRPGKARAGIPFDGVVRFGTGWVAEFVHFDSTAVRGVTPFARWRATVRRQVRPWLAECERNLPGTPVTPRTIRAHWHAKALVAALYAGMGWYLFTTWDDYDLATRTSWVVALALMSVSVIQLAAVLRNMGRYDVRIRLPEADDDIGVDSSVTCYYITEYDVRWPGPSGVRVATSTVYLDPDFRPVDAPRRRFPRVLRRRQPLPVPGVASGPEAGRLTGGLVAVRRHALQLLVVTEVDARLTSLRLAQRLRRRVYQVYSTVAGFSMAIAWQAHTTGMRLALGAAGVLTLLDLGSRWRRDRRRFAQIQWRPRIPADLHRDPCVLYLRPRCGDPDLDLDLHRLLSFAGKFRVGYRPDSPPPGGGIAGLPVPADDRLLAVALLNCRVVVVPAIATDPESCRLAAEAVRLLGPTRLLLIIPPGTTEMEYRRFRDATAAEFAEHGTVLPPHPVPADPPGCTPVLRGAIYFQEDWTPAVLDFTTAGPEHVRARLQPVFARLPAEAPFRLPGLDLPDDERPDAAGYGVEEDWSRLLSVVTRLALRSRPR